MDPNNENLQKLEEDLRGLSQRDQSTVSIPPPQQTPPLMHEVPRQKNKILTSLVVYLFLVSFGLAGVWAYQNYFPSGGEAGSSTKETPTTTSDPTVGWKVYTDPSRVFTFKYPNTFGEQGTVSGPINGNPKFVVSLSDPTTIVEGTDAPFNGFSVYTASLQGKTFNEYILEEKKDLENRGVTSNDATGLAIQATIKIGDVQAVSLTGPTFPNTTSYYVPTPDTKNLVVISRVKQSDNFLETFNQILSTFMFLGPKEETDISNWKTLQIPEYSFKYPETWRLDSNGKKITSSNPTITLWAFGSNDPMYNECMKLDNLEIEGDLTIKTFSRVVFSEMCSNTNTSQMEKWIVKTGGEGYQPGVQFIYQSTQKEEAEKLFDLIVSTFKFLGASPRPSATPR